MEDAKVGALFSRLDYEIPELTPVREAEARGDRRGAEQAFLRYYRERPQPNFGVRSGSVHIERGFAQNTTGYDFVIERYVEEFPDHHLTWRDRARMRPLISRERGYTWSRTQGTKPSEHTLIDIADMLLDNKVFTPSEPEKGIQDVGPRWDWTHIPDDGDVIWTHHLNYQLFQRALAQAYWLTGDAAYIEKLIWIARHYVLYVDTKPDWIWFPGLQMNHSYLQLMPYILSWEGLAGHDLCLLLSLYTGFCIEDMIAFANKEPPPQGNQLFYAGQGLITASVGFPECSDAPDWREQGLRIVGDYLGGGASYPDGTSKENSAGYVVGASTSVLETWLMLRDNGLSFPEDYIEVLLKRTAYLACSSKPDGSYVWNGDSRRGSALPFIGAMLAERYRKDWDYVANRGERGRPPARTSFWYPYCGHGIMRSSWQRDANYLQFDVGPIGTIHGHENALAVEVVSYGRSMVEDLGVHSYSAAAADVLMQQFMSWSQGHNTVVVDGKTQVRDVSGPYESARPLANVWHSTEICDYLEGSYREGYATYREERRQDGVPRNVIDGSGRPIGRACAQRAVRESGEQRPRILDHHGFSQRTRISHLRGALSSGAGDGGPGSGGQERSYHGRRRTEHRVHRRLTGDRCARHRRGTPGAESAGLVYRRRRVGRGAGSVRDVPPFRASAGDDPDRRGAAQAGRDRAPERCRRTPTGGQHVDEDRLCGRADRHVLRGAVGG